MKPLPPNILRAMSPKDRQPLGKIGKLNSEIDEAQQFEQEGALQKEIRQYLNMRGITYINPPFGKKSQLPEGWSDFTFSYHGHFCVIEAKAKSGKLSPAQIDFYLKITGAPNFANYVLVTDLTPVKAMLDQIDGETHS